MKEKYINLFNSIVINNNFDLNTLISGVSEYLTDINCEKTSEMITLLTQHPEIISMFNIIETIRRHLCIKYSINWVVYNNKVINFYGLKRKEIKKETRSSSKAI